MVYTMLKGASLISTMLMVFSCAPLPMIQSARVSGGPGINVTYTTPTLDLDVLNRNSCVDCSTDVVGETSDKKYPEQFPSNILFRMGILKRVEVSARILPYYLDPWFIAGGNVKVALLDICGEKLFRNVQSAIFAGGENTPIEHIASGSYWGGVLLGTHCPVGQNDLELVMALSGSKYRCYIEYIPVRGLTYTTMNLSISGIFKPFERKFLEVTAGITGRIPLNKSVEGYSNHSCYIQDHECITESEIEKYVVYPLVLQIGASVYVPDRR